jgi:hypothetical protein
MSRLGFVGPVLSKSAITLSHWRRRLVEIPRGCEPASYSKNFGAGWGFGSDTTSKQGLDDQSTEGFMLGGVNKRAGRVWEKDRGQQLVWAYTTWIGRCESSHGCNVATLLRTL